MWRDRHELERLNKIVNTNMGIDSREKFGINRSTTFDVVDKESNEIDVENVEGREAAKEIIREALTDPLFNPSEAIGGRVAIPYKYKEGGGKLALILGENASGKSLMRRILLRKARKTEKGINVLSPSMQHRMESGGIERSMVYGSERTQSTAYNSARMIRSLIKTVKDTSEKYVIYLDEPAIGMSPRVAAGAGREFSDFIKEDNPNVIAVFVTSHNPHFVRQLNNESLDPQYLYMGSEEGPDNVSEWVDEMANDIMEPISPEELIRTGKQRQKDIRSVQKYTRVQKGKKRMGDY